VRTFGLGEPQIGPEADSKGLSAVLENVTSEINDLKEWLRRAKSWSLALVAIIGRRVFSGSIDPGRLWRARPGAWQVLDFTA